MRITGVESTDLFQGSTRHPLQVIRVTVEGTEPRDAGMLAMLRIAGTGVETPDPFRITGTAPGESRTWEVAVAAAGQPGVARPVTVIAETADARLEHEATITVAEPGWTMWMVSHFHYDPVWWSTQGQFTEARLVLPDEDGELPNTRTAFELVQLHLEKARRDADYKFVLAEIDYLKPHFDAFPQDRAEMRDLIRAGRLELVGGTYNEPNTNLTNAELTIRNAVYGMGFQRDVMGADPRTAWMLDAFGLDPGFPGLMAAAGLTSSSWARGPFHQWGPADNNRMQFPAEFEWLSPDGTGVLTAYMANHYGAGWVLNTTKDLAAAEQAAYEQFRGLAPVAATKNVMLPVGSDHVIPARWVTDVHRSWNSRYVWPRFVTAIPREFFDAVRAEASGAAPASAGGAWITPQTRDMNPLYTGKDVSYVDTKQASRAGETAVAEGERLATLAWLGGAPYPAESLDKAWRQLVYGAHHDAITGTESDQVYLDLLAGWREAWQRGDEARRDAIGFLAGADGAESGAAGTEGGAVRSVTVWNGLARERDDMATVTVRLDEPGTPWLAVADGGTEVPALAEGIRRHPDGSLAEVTLVFRATRVPALGCRRYALRPTSVPAAPQRTAGEPAPGEPTASEPTAGEPAVGEPTAAGWGDVGDADGTGSAAIENEFFRVTADAARGGVLTAVTDKRTGRDVLRGPGNEVVLQEEYDKHPRWGEGPWNLTPKGRGTGSASVRARVRAQRSPAGSRLLATFELGGLSLTQETLLWEHADRVEFRTHVDGSIGTDQLLRVRFPADVPGGLPVYQTATAVIGRPFGVPEADVAKHWWTLDNPANQWFGLGSVARVALGTPGGPVRQAIGVAEVIAPDSPNGPRRLIRDLVVSLAAAGVTATCSRASGPRYGAVDIDSNLPDFRISVGGPDDNAFTAEVLETDPSAAKRLAALLTDQRAARLWVPAGKGRAEAFAPSADLRGPRDLPVLIVAGADDAALAGALAALRDDLADAIISADAADGAVAAGDRPLADGTVALFNRGTPSAVVSTDGTLWMSLMRACSSWPSGVWIDGDRRTAPDGSSFAWQHWSHTFCYALAATDGDWREAEFNRRAEDYNHDLIAVVTGPGAPAPDISEMSDEGGVGSPADSAAGAVAVSPANVTLTAFKPRGNPLASARPGTPPAEGEVTVRLRETDGRRTTAVASFAAGVASALRTDLLEEPADAPLEVRDGAVIVEVPPFGTVTFAARLAAAPSAAVAASAPAVTPAHAVAPARPVAEPVQPVYTRYWMHGTGPAPAGNLPVAVHFTPARATLNTVTPDAATPDAATLDAATLDRATPEDEIPEGETGARLRLTVACGPEAASGDVALIVPGGLTAQFGAGGLVRRYDLAPNEYAAWDVAIRADAAAAGGRYFVRARIRDRLGQELEDTALVTVGEPGEPDASLPPEELFFRLQADVQALNGEVDLTVEAAELRVAPGETGELAVRVANHLASALAGEAQLIAPFGLWAGTRQWTQGVHAAPGADTIARFPVAVPATASPGWESWLLVKLMYSGRVRYSQAVRLTAA